MEEFFHALHSIRTALQMPLTVFTKRILANIKTPLIWYPLNKLGYPNYSVSRSGFLMNHKTKSVTCGSKHASGMLQFSFTSPAGIKTKRYAHLVVVAMFKEPLPAHYFNVFVHHVDLNLANNHINNLCWVIKQDNKNSQTKLDRGVGKPITLFKRNPKIEYNDYIDVISYFSIEDAIKDMKLEASAKDTIELAIKDRLWFCGYHWCYEDQSADGEIWRTLTQRGYETIKVSSKGRIKTMQEEVGFGFVNRQYKYREFLHHNLHQGGYTPVRVDALVMRAFYGQDHYNAWIANKKNFLYHLDGCSLNSNIYNLAFQDPCFLNANFVKQNIFNLIQRMMYETHEISDFGMSLHLHFHFGYPRPKLFCDEDAKLLEPIE
jgi:HNH endonuclease